MTDNRQQPKPPKAQYLSAKTAARKLGVYLPATPPEFQESQISRTDFDALQADPPEWLKTLRKDGPHPRDEVARRLGVTNSGLARAGIADVLTTDEINALIAEMPDALRVERVKLGN